MFLTIILMRRKVIVWSKEHFLLQLMNQYMTYLLFGYLDKDFEEMDQLYTRASNIHLSAFIWDSYYQCGSWKALLRLENL